MKFIIAYKHKAVESRKWLWWAYG